MFSRFSQIVTKTKIQPIYIIKNLSKPIPQEWKSSIYTELLSDIYIKMSISCGAAFGFYVNEKPENKPYLFIPIIFSIPYISYSTTKLLYTTISNTK